MAGCSSVPAAQQAMASFINSQCKLLGTTSSTFVQPVLGACPQALGLLYEDVPPSSFRLVTLQQRLLDHKAAMAESAPPPHPFHAVVEGMNAKLQGCNGAKAAKEAYQNCMIPLSLLHPIASDKPRQQQNISNPQGPARPCNHSQAQCGKSSMALPRLHAVNFAAPLTWQVRCPTVFDQNEHHRHMCASRCIHF